MASLDEIIFKYIILFLYFIGVYFFIFWLLVFLEKSKHNERNLKIKNDDFPSLIICLPIYNKDHCLKWCLNSIYKKNGEFRIDYPKEKLKIVCVDDGSTDNSLKILRKLKKKYNFTLLEKKNGGKHTALNLCLKKFDSELFACLDADCIVLKNSVKKLATKFIKDKEISSTMPQIKVYKPKNLIERLQYFEYVLNFFMKNIFSNLDCIHVVPGPLGMFKTKLIRKYGYFKEAYKTEDLEMALRFQSKNEKLVQVLDSVVYTKVPYNSKNYISQRVRWYKGAFLNVFKNYRYIIFNKNYGEFGTFQIPLVAFGSFLIFLGTISFLYIFIKNLIDFFKVLIIYNFDLITYFSNLNFNFSLVNLNWENIFITFIVFFLFFIIIFLSFKHTNEKISILTKFKYLFMIFYFFVIYRFLLTYIWVKVFYEINFKKNKRWESVEK